MKHYKPFAYAPVSAPHAELEPDNPIAALGEVAIRFERLDGQLAAAIGVLLRKSDDVATVLTAEMSFQVKLKVFAGLVRLLYPSADSERLRELCAVCGDAEAQRNAALHSKWNEGDDSYRLVRTKSTVKIKRGLLSQCEVLHVEQIADIGLYCDYAAESVYEYMLERSATEAVEAHA